MTDFNENITRLYQSYPETQYRYLTLEFYHPVSGYDYFYRSSVPVDKDFRLGPDDPIDPNVVKTMVASNFDIKEPNQDANTNSVINVNFDIQALDRMNEIIDLLEEDPINFQTPLRLVYRIYHNLDTDIGQSQKETISYLSSASMSAENGVQLTFTTTNNATVRTGNVYSLVDFSGLYTNV